MRGESPACAVASGGAGDNGAARGRPRPPSQRRLARSVSRFPRMPYGLEAPPLRLSARLPDHINRTETGRPFVARDAPEEHLDGVGGDPLSHALRPLRPSSSAMTSLAFMSRSLPASRPVESPPVGKAEGACPAAPCVLLPEAPRRGEGVRGCSRQPPPIGAERRFVRGSVSAPDAAQRRRNTWEWDGWRVGELA